MRNLVPTQEQCYLLPVPYLPRRQVALLLVRYLVLTREHCYLLPVPYLPRRQVTLLLVRYTATCRYTCEVASSCNNVGKVPANLIVGIRRLIVT